MRARKPSIRSTVEVDARSWRPSSLEDLLSEVKHLRESAAGGPDKRVVLYRGQEDSLWEINSTFARAVASRFDPNDLWYGNRVHQAFLDKFSAAGIQPTAGLLAAADRGCDPWFELMKRIQQHPDEFSGYQGVPGSNLVDWSRSPHVAMAFAAADQGKEGAVFLLDAVAAGTIFVDRMVREILDLIAEALERGEVHGRPILFSPRSQIAYERARRQQAAYLAQMDLRHSLETVWQACEAERQDGEAIYWRLLLSKRVKAEADALLQASGCTLSWLLEPRR